jgi:hypothetical protein
MKHSGAVTREIAGGLGVGRAPKQQPGGKAAKYNAPHRQRDSAADLLAANLAAQLVAHQEKSCTVVDGAVGWSKRMLKL